MGRDIELDVDGIDVCDFNMIINLVNECWLKVKLENSTVPDTQKIAVLTSVKIAIELFKLVDSEKNIAIKYEKKLKKVIDNLNETDYIKID
jgi:cell division protein ZapA (FtsZ GTPase activity inhibitor)